MMGVSSEKSKTPTWAWVIICLVLGLVCLVIGVIITHSFFAPTSTLNTTTSDTSNNNQLLQSSCITEAQAKDNASTLYVPYGDMQNKIANCQAKYPTN